MLGAVLITKFYKMEKKYIVKDFEAQTYYSGYIFMNVIFKRMINFRC